MAHPIVTATPIMFAQTREDPMVEINAVKSLASQHPLSICLIASSGDTVCSVVAHQSSAQIAKIDVVDSNFDQLCLAKLKIALLETFIKDINIKFLCSQSKKVQPSLSEEFLRDILQVLVDRERIDTNVYDYWMGHFDILCQGVNRMGRFELLFKAVMLDEDFEKHFSHDNLTKIFGVNATKHSMNKPFAEHFANILEIYRKTYADPKENYFYHQFVNDNYSSLVDADMPLYLSTKGPIKVEFPIEFYQNNMMDHLKAKADLCYDLVQLSNITDWLSPEIFCELLNQVGRVLRPNGKCTLRRLNSDISLEKSINEFNKNNYKYQFIMETKVFDKSHFYAEVLVISKKLIC